MKAFLIDPVKRTIEEVEHNNSLESIYQLIDARVFQIVPLDGSENVVYVDEEGLFKEGQSFFLLRDFPQPLAGKGLVMAHDQGGETVSPSIALKNLKELVRFLDAKKVESWASQFR